MMKLPKSYFEREAVVTLLINLGFPLFAAIIGGIIYLLWTCLR